MVNIRKNLPVMGWTPSTTIITNPLDKHPVLRVHHAKSAKSDRLIISLMFVWLIQSLIPRNSRFILMFFDGSRAQGFSQSTSCHHEPLSRTTSDLTTNGFTKWYSTILVMVCIDHHVDHNGCLVKVANRPTVVHHSEGAIQLFATDGELRWAWQRSSESPATNSWTLQDSDPPKKHRERLAFRWCARPTSYISPCWTKTQWPNGA